MRYLVCFAAIALVMAGCADDRQLSYRDNTGHLADSSGAVGIVEGDYTGQPADTETWTIGGTTYEADSVGGVTEPNVAVSIGGDADTTYATLVSAIDVQADLVDADVPALGRLRIRTAESAGGAVVASSSSIALAETAASFAWRGANTNQAGRSPAGRRREICRRTADALFVAAASARVCEFTWTPANIVDVYISTSAGVMVTPISTDQFTIAGNAVVWTSAGATHVANTQTMSITVEE